MSAIDKVTQHWENISGEKPIEVEEWDLTVYWTPLNLKEQAQFQKIVDREGPTAAGAMILIRKCCDEKGDPLFTLADKPKLMRKADPKVIERICNTISRSDDVEDLEGN